MVAEEVAVVVPLVVGDVVPVDVGVVVGVVEWQTLSVVSVGGASCTEPCGHASSAFLHSVLSAFG